MYNFSFKMPRKAEIIVYDNNNSKYFMPFIKNKRYEILFTRKEKIYFYILLKAIFAYGFKNIYYNYKKIFIDIVKPKILITYTDNDLDFLKFKLKNIKKIAIQNSYRRACFPDLFSFLKYEKKKIYSLDHIFCFNNYIGKKYQSYLGCNFTSIGSLKNNIVKKKKNINKNSLAYISQFRPFKTNKSKNFLFDFKNFDKFMSNSLLKKKDFKNIKRSSFYEHDKKIFKHVSEFCKIKNLNLFVIGESKYFPEDEKNFYSQITKNKFKFLKRKSEDSSYKYIDKFEYITGVDSTMLYESSARGKKVAFFSGRESCFKGYKDYFNWPNNIYPKGLFWSNETNKQEIFRVLNNLKNKKLISTNNIIYDYKNTKIVKKLNKILNKI